METACLPVLRMEEGEGTSQGVRAASKSEKGKCIHPPTPSTPGAHSSTPKFRTSDFQVCMVIRVLF